MARAGRISRGGKLHRFWVDRYQNRKGEAGVTVRMNMADAMAIVEGRETAIMSLMDAIAETENLAADIANLSWARQTHRAMLEEASA
jgi:hypothetical protein